MGIISPTLPAINEYNTTADPKIISTFQAILDLVNGGLTAANLDSSLTASIWTPGDIKMFGGSAVPSGWLACNGDAVSRSTYSALFSAIGTTHGIGDNSTTFNLPDLKGRAPIGSGTGSGLTARTAGTKLGTETHPLSVGELPVHAHTITDPGHGHSLTGDGNGNYLRDDGADSVTTYEFTYPDSNPGGHLIKRSSRPSITSSPTGITTTNSNGSGTSHNNMQPSTVVLFVIKT